MSKSTRPGALLYKNSDMTASGRYPHAPFIDFLLTIKDTDEAILQIEAVNSFTGQTLKKLTFDLQASYTAHAALLGDNPETGCYRAAEDPSWVLCRLRGGGKAKWKLERRIELDEDNDGSLL